MIVITFVGYILKKSLVKYVSDIRNFAFGKTSKLKVMVIGSWLRWCFDFYVRYINENYNSNRDPIVITFTLFVITNKKFDLQRFLPSLFGKEMSFKVSAC